MTPLEFYSSLLTSTGLTVGSNGYALHRPDDDIPIEVSKKVLALPTQEVLDSFNQNKDSIMVFHPVCENVMRKDSTVFNFLKKLYRISLSNDIISLMEDILELSSKTEGHTKLKKGQREIIAMLEGVDDKTLTNITKVLERSDATGDHKLINISVHRGGSISGTEYNRTAVVHYSLLEAIDQSQDDRVFGVKLRKKDLTVMKALYRLIVNAGENQYILGSNAQVAPSFTVLTQAYHDVKKAIITTAKVFKERIRRISSDDLSWYEQLESLSTIKALLPVFPGNDGEALPDQPVRKQLVKEERKVVNRHDPRQGVITKVVEQPQPEPTKPTSGTRSFADIFKKQSEMPANPPSRYARYQQHRYNPQDDLDLSFVDPQAAQQQAGYGRYAQPRYAYAQPAARTPRQAGYANYSYAQPRYPGRRY